MRYNLQEGDTYTIAGREYRVAGDGVKRINRKATNRGACWDVIRNVICESFAVTMDDLRSKIRKERFVRARKAVAYYAHQYAGLTTEEIGILLNVNHSSITYFITCWEDMKKTGSYYRAIDIIILSKI